MSESADDPTLLNIPASWKQYLTKEPHFLQNLLAVISLIPDTDHTLQFKIKALAC